MTEETKLVPGEIAKPDPQALAQVNGNGDVATFGGGDGGWVPPTAKIYFEFLDITYGTGFAVEKGLAPGQLVFGREHIIAKPKTPLTCVILQATSFWREEKTYDPNTLPREWPTEAAAKAAGMRTLRTPKGSGLPMPDCRPGAVFELFVQEPATPTTSMAFTLLFGGKKYAAARFKVAGSQFACVEKMLAQLPAMDAAKRGRPPAEGTLRAFFVTFTVDPLLDPTTRKVKTRLWLNPVMDANGQPLRVPDEFWADVRQYQDQLKAVQSQAAATSEEDAPEGSI